MPQSVPAVRVVRVCAWFLLQFFFKYHRVLKSLKFFFVAKTWNLIGLRQVVPDCKASNPLIEVALTGFALSMSGAVLVVWKSLPYRMYVCFWKANSRDKKASRSSSSWLLKFSRSGWICFEKWIKKLNVTFLLPACVNKVSVGSVLLLNSDPGL